MCTLHTRKYNSYFLTVTYCYKSTATAMPTSITLFTDFPSQALIISVTKDRTGKIEGNNEQQQ